jgi:pyruvate/2-oxoglutarate dehydrogenase complex dihydrolipoamide dehydrogenase (E3) component
MGEVLRPDLCIIGAGSGGLSVAAAAAAFGVPVVLIEKGRMGGDCLNYGCVPSKALIASAKRAALPRHAGSFGISIPRPTVDFARVHDSIQSVIAAIAPMDSKERFTGLGVRVIQGEARFKNRSTVVVGNDWEIKARRFVIATGSSPAIPPIPGLPEVPHYTNETIFDLTECPGHLIVIGAGPIGLELAQAHRRLGAAVTVLEAARPLAKDDPECSQVVVAELMREGVTIRTGVEVVRIEAIETRVRVQLRSENGEESIDGTHLLVATGRRSNSEGLDLEAAGIRQEENRILVDERLTTSNRRVYAIGDAASAAHFTHVANYHAGIVIRRSLFRIPARVQQEAIPWVTYTDPELAHVGLMEIDVRKKGTPFRVLRASYHDNDRAQIARATRGHVKVITTPRGRILGATIVGSQAGELITTWTLAIQHRLNVRALTDVIVPYPTLNELNKRAAISFFVPSLTSPWVRRIISFLRWLG